MERAVYALCRISQRPDGVQAIVDANVLVYIGKLIGSPNAEVRRWTCNLLAWLASAHQSIALATLELKPYAKLVSLLR